MRPAGHHAAGGRRPATAAGALDADVASLVIYGHGEPAPPPPPPSTVGGSREPSPRGARRHPVVVVVGADKRGRVAPLGAQRRRGLSLPAVRLARQLDAATVDADLPAPLRSPPRSRGGARLPAAREVAELSRLPSASAVSLSRPSSRMPEPGHIDQSDPPSPPPHSSPLLPRAQTTAFSGSRRQLSPVRFRQLQEPLPLPSSRSLLGKASDEFAQRVVAALDALVEPSSPPEYIFEEPSEHNAGNMCAACARAQKRAPGPSGVLPPLPRARRARRGPHAIHALRRPRGRARLAGSSGYANPTCARRPHRTRAIPRARTRRRPQT